MKTSIPAVFQKRDKYASFHERRFAAMDIQREADSIRQLLPHGAKGNFDRILSQMIKHLLNPSESGKALYTADIKNRVSPRRRRGTESENELPINTLRRVTIYDFIAFAVAFGKNEFDIVFSVVELAKLAPKEFPFEFSKLDAWRIVVDLMIDRGDYTQAIYTLLRNAAREEKHRTFVTNQPCDNGNIAECRTSDGVCLCAACREYRSVRDRNRRLRNPGKNALDCKNRRITKILEESRGGAK